MGSDRKMYLVSKWVIFHFHDYGRKGTPLKQITFHDHETVYLPFIAEIQFTQIFIFTRHLLRPHCGQRPKPYIYKDLPEQTKQDSHS